MSRTESLSGAMECNATPYSTIFVLFGGSTIFVPIQGSTIIVPWKTSTIFVLYVFSTNFVLLSVSVLFCSSSLIYKEKLLLQALCSKFGYTISGPGFGRFSWFSGCSQWEQSIFSYGNPLIHRFLSNGLLGTKQDHPASFRSPWDSLGGGFSWISWCSQWPQSSFSYSRTLFHRFLSSAPLGRSRNRPGASLVAPLGPVETIPRNFHLHRPFPALTLGFMQ